MSQMLPWYSPAEPRDTCLLICLILANSSARHLPAQVPEILERTLEGPLECKEINLSILKEINPEYSLEGLMLNLKLQYFGHMMRRTDSLEKTLMLG